MQGGSVRWAWTLTPQMMCQIYFLNTCDLLNPTPQYFILTLWNRRMNKTVFSTPGPYVISFALLIYNAMDCLILNELVHEHLIYYILVVDRILGGGGNQEFSDIKSKENQEVMLSFSIWVHSTKLIADSCGCCLFQSKNMGDLCSRTRLPLGWDQSYERMIPWKNQCCLKALYPNILPKRTQHFLSILRTRHYIQIHW